MSSLSDGYYCLDASLYQHVDDAYWVDFHYACFTVGSTSSGNHSDAFMDIDFDYEITQIDDDTIGLAYTVNNSGDWAVASTTKPTSTLAISLTTFTAT